MQMTHDASEISPSMCVNMIEIIPSQAVDRCTCRWNIVFISPCKCLRNVRCVSLSLNIRYRMMAYMKLNDKPLNVTEYGNSTRKRHNKHNSWLAGWLTLWLAVWWMPWEWRWTCWWHTPFYLHACARTRKHTHTWPPQMTALLPTKRHPWQSLFLHCNITAGLTAHS